MDATAEKIAKLKETAAEVVAEVCAIYLFNFLTLISFHRMGLVPQSV